MSGEVHHVVPGRGGRGTKRRVPENSKSGGAGGSGAGVGASGGDPPGKKSKSELNTPDLAPNA